MEHFTEFKAPVERRTTHPAPRTSRAGEVHRRLGVGFRREHKKVSAFVYFNGVGKKEGEKTERKSFKRKRRDTWQFRTMAEKRRKFEITSFQSCLSDAVTKITSWHEISVAATVQYNEEKEQCLHNLHKQGKKLKKYKELKRENERKLEEVEKEYKSILEEVQKGNQILLNLIKSSNATLRQSTSYKGNENSMNTIFDVDVEDEDHVASEKSVEISGPVRKKLKRNEDEVEVE
ncbi:uncharacterized protein LOC121970767 isoform X2 [Zingiber officinale]|uniref:uncharacterized protein LOC121970767 isoform X2 n=1 Tax=Zingiber officinale TaxID=94328 RepID=UPI001C4B3069|nr:uncharacterized protein LOC121970767 isoform X2 [Zingiber officinale]